MPSQHKHPPVSFRPPEALRERLLAHAAETGSPVGAIITAAVEAYLPGGEDQQESDCTEQDKQTNKGEKL
jgi:predicted DNA-binding protein